MKVPQPDGSRDPRIEDPTNLWIVHPVGRMLLPWFVTRGISANAVSVCGLVLGTLAALAYARWTTWPFALVGLALSLGWLVADGLDGMIARATGTASAVGRILDGMCDHGVFILIYVVLATTLGTAQGWALACAAGVLHALQSNLYEGERARFHRRLKGLPPVPQAASRNPLALAYDKLMAVTDRMAHGFDRALRDSADPQALGRAYAADAVPPLRLMSLLTANVRVYAIFVACLAGDPRFFWWFEIVPLTTILVIGLLWHRQVEYRFLRHAPVGAGIAYHQPVTHTKDVP